MLGEKKLTWNLFLFFSLREEVPLMENQRNQGVETADICGIGDYFSGSHKPVLGALFLQRIAVWTPLHSTQPWVFLR